MVQYVKLPCHMQIYSAKFLFHLDSQYPRIQHVDRLHTSRVLYLWKVPLPRSALVW
jgi:hypothetical protein